MTLNHVIRFCAEVIFFVNVTFSITLVYNQTYYTKTKCTEKSHLYKEQYKPFIYIGIMSTRTNIETRLEAALNTWLKLDNTNLHKHSKIEVFAKGSDSLNDSNSNYQVVEKNGLKIIQLPGVRDEDYPPQKKSFLMLKYMERMHLNNFHWFVRVDDDSYINLKKLQQFLNKVNSSKPFYIGRAGFGQNADDFLNFTETYCMGGTGMIFSRELLRQIGPRLEHCYQHSLTEHEDIEVGRCVRSVAQVQCTQSNESMHLFYQPYQSNQQNIENINLLRDWVFKNIITLHAIKDQKVIYRYHSKFLSHKIEFLLKKIAKYSDMFNDSSQRPAPFSSEQFIWNGMSTIKKIKISPTSDIQLQRMGPNTVILYQKEKYRNRKYFEWKASIRFTAFDTYFYEKLTNLYSLERKYLIKGKNETHSEYIFAMINEKWKYCTKFEFMNEKNIEMPIVSQPISSPNETDCAIYFIVTFSERRNTFLKFIKNFEDEVLKRGKNVKLIVSTVSPAPKSTDSDKHDAEIINSTLTELKTKYDTDFHVLISLDNNEEYSRYIGLKRAADLVTDENAILFFCDIDFSFQHNLLDSIKKNTVKTKAVYYPIYFSKYNPEVINQTTNKNDTYCDGINESTGFWIYNNYTILSIYNGDFQRVKRFKTLLQNQEDAELLDRLIKSGFEIFRSKDDSIVHNYQHMSCNGMLRYQKKLCELSKYSKYASRAHLYKTWIDQKRKKIANSLGYTI